MANALHPESLSPLLAANKDFYSSMRSRMKYKHKLYKQEFQLDVDLPDGIGVFKSSKATTLVDELRDQINVADPQITARVAKKSKQARETATKQEMWGRYCLETIAQEGLVNPVGQARHDMVLRGAAALKYWPKTEVMRLRADGKQAANLFPFYVKALDPLLLYPSPGPGPLKYMLEVQERRAMDIWEAYPQWTDPKAHGKMSKADRDNPLREVSWLEFWSWGFNPQKEEFEGHYIIEVDGERIKDDPNMYMHVPYVYRYSGMGRQNEDGDPAELAIGILDVVGGEIEAEVQVKTAMNAQWQFHVFPVLQVWGIDAKEAHQILRSGPGAIMDFGSLQGKAEWLQREAPNAQMLTFLDNIESAIARRVNPALSGQKTADFGIQQALQIGQALKVIQPVRDSLNYMGSQLLEGMASMMETFDIEMNVHGRLDGVDQERTMKGKDFKHRSLEVEFEATDPSDNDRRMLALLAVERVPGHMSKETFSKAALKDIVEDWDEEQEKILAEQILEQFVESGALGQVVMQELGLLRQEAATEEQETAATNRAQGAVRAATAEVAGRERGVEGLAGTAPLVESRAAQGQGQTNASRIQEA